MHAEPISLAEYPNPVVHLDADSFFVSVEEALDPSLKGRPVVTGAERGVVSSANAEAKARGVSRPMTIAEARRACPGLVCLASDYETYSLFSVRFFAILRRFTPVVEEHSVDEAFAELSGLRRLYRKDFPSIARDMKAALEKELGVRVSAGLGPSKTLAKIASARAKPGGFAAVPCDELHRFLPGVKTLEVGGIGPNSAALLEKHGIRTAWDFVSRPEAFARKLLGKTGGELWRELRGEAVYALDSGPKTSYASVTKCKTFAPPSSDPDYVRAQIVRNAESAFIKLRRHGLKAGGMLAYLRDDAFRAFGAEAELERPTSSAIEAAHLASMIFSEIFDPSKAYRQTGVVLYSLIASSDEQLSLFDDAAKVRSLRAIDDVIDRANGRFGKHTLHAATALPLGRRGEKAAGARPAPDRRERLLPGEDARRRLGLPLWKLPLR